MTKIRKIATITAFSAKGCSGFRARMRASAKRYSLRRLLAAMMQVAAGVMILASGAAAQTAIDPGVISRQNEIAPPFERDREPIDTGAPLVRDAPAPTLPAAARPAPVIAPDAPGVIVTGWRFSGNSLIDTAALQALLSGYLGREMRFAEIEAATGEVAEFYLEQGYVATAALPPQEVTDGLVLIEIEEARFGGIVFEGAYPQRVDPDLIERHFTFEIAPGDPVRPADFERPLLLANDLPGVSLSGVFAPGRDPGETVLLLDTTDDSIGRAQASVDNFGARATGEERVNAQVTLVSPLGVGDFLQGAVTLSEGLLDGRVRYSAPIGASGLRGSVHLNSVNYEIVADEFAALDAEGGSVEYGAGLSYPVLRGRDASVKLLLNHDRKRLTNDIRGAEVSDYHVQQTTLGANGTLFDSFGGGGASSLAFSYSFGAADGRNAGGSFNEDFGVWRLTATRQQRIAADTSLYLSLSAQRGSDDLDSSEFFTLGGPVGVRAYPTGEASGPSGYLATAELRQRVFEDFTLKLFVDHGRVTDRMIAGEPSSYDLTGIGAGIVWDAPLGFRADLTYAHRIGDNPNADPLTGKDRDGSLREHRVWFSLSKAF